MSLIWNAECKKDRRSLQIRVHKTHIRKKSTLESPTNAREYPGNAYILSLRAP